MSTVKKTACAICGKDAATRCTGCIEGVNSSLVKVPTYYCSKDCQKAAWISHKAECRLANDRRQFCYAGSLLQSLFYSMRQNAFDLNITKVVKEGRIMLIYVERLSQAVLAWSACDDAIGRLHEVIKECLKGICAEIKEVAFQVDGWRQRCVLHDMDGSPLHKHSKQALHHVLKITLKDGNSYALHLAGAQYGLLRATYTWATYKKMIVKVARSRPFGAQAAEMKRLVDPFYSAAGGQTVTFDQQTIIWAAQDQICAFLLKVVRHWAEKNGEELAQVVRSALDTYAAKVTELVELVECNLVDLVAEMKAKGGLLGKEVPFPDELSEDVRGITAQLQASYIKRGYPMEPNDNVVLDAAGYVPDPHRHTPPPDVSAKLHNVEGASKAWEADTGE